MRSIVAMCFVLLTGHVQRPEPERPALKAHEAPKIDRDTWRDPMPMIWVRDQTRRVTFPGTPKFTSHDAIGRTIAVLPNGTKIVEVRPYVFRVGEHHESHFCRPTIEHDRRRVLLLGMFATGFMPR